MRTEALLVALAIASACAAQEVSEAAVQAAVEAGIVWIGDRAIDGGGFESAHTGSHTEGTASLGLLTLLKAGVPPDHPLIEEGFAMLRTRTFVKTYDVALTIMAIEARYKPPEKLLRKAKNQPASTVTRKAFDMLAPRQDKKLLDKLVESLIENQKEDGGWRYPGGDGSDNSATQYAMLGLKSALRLGWEVPTEVFVKAAERMLGMQQEDGPEVSWFDVPAADRPIDEYLKPKDRRESYDDMTTEERPVESFNDEHLRMHARGFGYTVESTGQNGSMTAAGVAILVICKSELEARREAAGWWRANGNAVNRAIRDSGAWLAHHFSVTENPRNPGKWDQYYLYGLERAGMLMGTYLLGERDWYVEGAEHLLATQEDDGSWLCHAEGDRFVDTCFSLLFLKRATIPVLELPPPRVATGE